MIADPDVNNDDVSKRYTHDTIRPISYYGGEKKVDLGFVGSCMVHKGDMKIISQMLRNIEQQQGTVEFKAPLVVAPPTYNIVNELKAEGDWDVLQKYAGFEFDDSAPKEQARTKYQNVMYLERPGCNLCMGNQEKAEKGDTVMATSTRLFQGRVVADSEEKKGEVPARLDPRGRALDHPRPHAEHRRVHGGSEGHQAHELRAADPLRHRRERPALGHPRQQPSVVLG